MPRRIEIAWEVNENGCFICTSHKVDKDGYPRVVRDGRGHRMHRYLYQKVHGELDSPDVIIRHSCDQPLCINVDHLKRGTTQDNMRDKMSRNRQAKGSDVGTSKLTESQVRLIKYFYLGWRLREIADLYSVSLSQISRIRTGKLWAHL